MDAPLATKLRNLVQRLGFERDWSLIVMGAVVGSVTALGAIGFHEALVWTEHRSREAMELWWGWIVLVPMAGALATGLLVHYFARDARGHGVPQVIHAVAVKKGVIPIRVGVVKILASIATVGSGGSSGAEGPIVQIGATAGSALGRFMRAGAEHQNTLVGCGAAAGIASVFNAPITGVLFVMEIILRDFSLKTFTPIVVAAVFSTALTQAILGVDDAIFATTLEGYQFTLAELPFYILLGLLCAMIGVAFTKTLHAGEEAFERLKLHPVARPVSGALLLGLSGLLFVAITSRADMEAVVPPFFGNGYETIRWTIDPASYGADGRGAPGLGAETGLRVSFILLALLVAFKTVATTFTLGSGGSGGVFAPSLFVGAAAGGAFGLVLANTGVLPAGSSPATFALVGMGAVVAATTFAPLTAILLLFELTREPLVLLPIMLAAVIATVSGQLMMRDSIYTSKLKQAGVLLGWSTDLAALRSVPVASCELSRLPPEPVYPSDPVSKLITLHAQHHLPDFPVVDQETGAYLGMVTGADIRTALIDREAIPLLLVAELLRPDLPTVSRDETLETVMDKFSRADTASLVVVSPIDETLPMAMISRQEVVRRYRVALEA